MAQAKTRSKSKPKAEAVAPVAPASVAAMRSHGTYADYCAIPDDGLRYEVIRGELLVAPAPLTIHQAILYELTLVLGAFIKRKRSRGVLRPGRVSQPISAIPMNN